MGKDTRQNSNQMSDNDYKEILSLNLNQVFDQYLNRAVDASYLDREDRNRFAAEQIKTLGQKNILNIGGGGKRHLKKNLDDSFNVFEIDMAGECDLELNLDKIDGLPFEDNSFDLCCAFDVLEHLEQFHLINSELYRISKSSVLISLPNSAFEIYFNVMRNRSQKIPDLNRGTFSKYYGLPLGVPEDRHRWWLYFHDIVRFYYFFAQSKKCKLEFWTVKKGLKMRVLSSCFGQHMANSFFIPHIWVKISKNNPTQKFF
jgi:hypothetical protein